MIKNYIKIAWRSIFANKFYTGINILGLSAGLVVGIFLLLWIQDELSFDRFHKNERKIYKIGIEGGTGITKKYLRISLPLLALLQKKRFRK
ncbi:hypothetical protein [Sphingobacterium sp. IITKGP-BTPF85]|uniref:hypothetical protein n=1 Tax=Sphingobacterium sp. IITKGP-BTPF85 TaxID=1338009 RepID=UPI00038A3691|nr:hypothetical protein [Sphingobacterium sp. IITKGP-BTPF85]KKX50903.1 hypothetical protein L950_0207690 [Sphingobacterium sp. IITKGP-BTPF85]